MKKFILLLIIPLLSFGQITTTKIVKKKIAEPEPYDSLKNFLGKNPENYIGQDLYLRGTWESSQKFGYRGFLNDYMKDNIDDGNVYKCCSESSKYSSNYEKLHGKYFTVLDVINHPKAKSNPALYGDEFFLYLQEKESKDKLYYNYSSNLSASFPFATVGYFVKLKEIYLNKSFVFKHTGTFTDITTGEVITPPVGTTWTCVDVTIDEENHWIGLVLENSKNEKIFKNMAQFERVPNAVFPLSIAKDYEERFSLENWHLILLKKIKVGFTKEMVELSWGSPKSINRSSTGDQWVYSNQYVYFDNSGIMTAFN